jgi:hypothetical protein
MTSHSFPGGFLAAVESGTVFSTTASLRITALLSGRYPTRVEYYRNTASRRLDEYASHCPARLGIRRNERYSLGRGYGYDVTNRLRSHPFFEWKLVQQSEYRQDIYIF